MSWTRASTSDHLPADAAIDAVAEGIAEILQGSTVEVLQWPATDEGPDDHPDACRAMATGDGPPGWRTRVAVSVGTGSLGTGGAQDALLSEILEALPAAGLRAASRLRPSELEGQHAPGPTMRRAMRDVLALELLAALLSSRLHHPLTVELLDEILDFLIELSGTRVESHDLTHGVVITDVLRDEPRLRFAYPGDVRSAKRAPLLFDGNRSVLVVDLEGRARTELQRQRIDRLGTVGGSAGPTDEFIHGGSLVAEATSRLGGVGFLLRADRTIWAFVDGQPLLVRRGEHWTAFPLELAANISRMIGGGAAADIVVQAAFTISVQRHGAILAIVEDPDALDPVVPRKDRYDLRNEMDTTAMRAETRLHHLIDANELDGATLVRLAALDGATILDRDAHLLAYGAIVASADSEHEGARTAAAKTLSHVADVVLKVSADGDITIFRRGAAITTLLAAASRSEAAASSDS